MDVYLIRKLPDFVDDATPLLHADTLELVDKNELRRILDPIEPKNQDQSWVPKSSVAIRRRSASDSLQERLSIEWDHLSDLDAGVEILTQDADELHRVTRRLATALEEAVFPTAIRDFRNPALWQTFLERTSDGGRDPETDLRRLRLEAPRLSPDELASSLLLWGVDINPPFDRLKKASNRLMGENFTTNDEDRTRIIEGVLAKYVAKENQNDWVELHRSLADYLAAIFAYQRTPLAPATPEDRTGLDAITAAARAMFLGLKVDPIVPTANPLHDLTSIHQGIVTREAILRKSLDDLATIDLSALHVNDAPDEYSRIKRKLQDIDLARRLARIIELRSSLAADILTSDGVAEAVSEAIDGDDPERLPGYNEWQDLAHQLFLAFSNVEKGNPTVVTTPSDHGLLTGQVVSISDVAGMTGLNGKTSKIEVIDGEKRKFRLVEIDSTNFGAYTGGGRALRDDMTYSKSLFDLFDGDLAVASGTGQAGAGELSNVLTRIRDPLNLLFKDNTGEVAKKYRNEVAGLVTQAAGLTAALDALKRDAEAQKWTLVRRPHHQIGIESTEPDGRTHVKQKLRDLLPDPVGGPNRSETEQPPPLTSEQLESLNPDGLIVPFSNLLERLGFAIDLAVVDNLNQPLSQRRLLQWLDGQAWSAIRATIGEFGHQVIIVSGREPDTGRDNPDTDSLNEDRSLGYGFVKLIVVPDCLLADLFGRRIEIPGVTINFDAQTLKLSVGFTATPLSQFRAKFGAQDRLMVIFKNIEPISFNIDKLEAIPASGNPASSSVTIDGYTGTLPAGAQTVEVVAVNGNRSNFRSWLKIRGIEPVTDDDTPAEKDLELRIVQKMARAWWQSTERLSFLDRKIKDPILHSIVETRSRRWATVPVLGGRAHLDWSADDAAGREILIAVRRVSRYEALLRWARGGAIPLVTRLYGRELDKYSQPVELARRMRAGIEEPATVPVLISPHPTRIDFVYALPTSGARATVSGLSARRNGFRGMGLHFSQKRLEAGESHQINQQDLIQKLQRRYLEDTITVTAVTTDFKWTVAFADTAPSAFDAIIVFDATHNKVRVCEQFTPEEGHPNQGTLQFVADPSGQFTPDLNSKLNVLIYRESGLKLQFPLGNVTGTIVRNGPDLRQFRLKPDPEADRLDENPRTYEGQLLFLLAQGKPTRVRVIKSFTPNDQILTLEQPLPNEVASSAVSILHGAPLPHRTPIVRSEGGTPTIFRYERQVSLPALPYYREYSLEVSPQFDAIPFGAPPDLADRKDTVFARRRPSLVAIHPALVTTTHKTNDSTEVTKHTFRLFLTRQGDLLTPQEAAVAVELDREDRLVRPSGTNAMLSENVSDADLPDLCCQYQLLWKIDESQEGNDVGAELVELLLPGHPLWAPPQNGTDGKANPVMLRNRTSVNVAKLEKESADPNGTASLCYLPIQVWQPTAAARPVYVVVFQVNITSDAALDDAKKMFWDPNRLVLQVQRGGYPSQLLPVFVDPS
ncbi:MAG: hypothetical protein NT069_32180 [Planctomycetota bacterium]|nr:hypothetical protein [Planctomycetota bacterium]